MILTCITLILLPMMTNILILPMMMTTMVIMEMEITLPALISTILTWMSLQNPKMKRKTNNNVYMTIQIGTDHGFIIKFLVFKSFKLWFKIMGQQIIIIMLFTTTTTTVITLPPIQD